MSVHRIALMPAIIELEDLYGLQIRLVSLDQRHERVRLFARPMTLSGQSGSSSTGSPEDPMLGGSPIGPQTQFDGALQSVEASM